MAELYDAVMENLTWHKLNSNFKDPMYQYMYNLQLELYAKYKAPLLSTNYKTVDDFVVNAKNETLYYGSYECSAPGKKAFMDSMFSCFLFQIPFFLEKFQIGWIGFVFVLPIMLISLFGGIKESYRWFILNQAIWDAFLCYDFICAKPTLLGWSNLYSTQNTCFYRDDFIDLKVIPFFIKLGFRVCLRNASFIPVFHLAFSRFICMYFPGFYSRFTKNGYKIFIFILLFNIFCMALFSFASLSVGALLLSGTGTGSTECDVLCPSRNTTTYCFQNIPKFFQCSNQIAVNFNDKNKFLVKLGKFFKYLSFSIPPTMFFLSIICTGLLFWKIASQLQFQLKTNRESFKQTIKISSVVAFQCTTMSAIFLITGIQKFMQIKGQIAETSLIYDELPIWLLLLQYYTTTASLNMIRILLDSCIILTVLNGYSKCVILTLKILWLSLTNPKKAYKKIKHIIKGPEVTRISSTMK